MTVADALSFSSKRGGDMGNSATPPKQATVHERATAFTLDAAADQHTRLLPILAGWLPYLHKLQARNGNA